jgi:hypothetical protein
VFKGIRIDIKGYEMRVYLIPFELHDFDVILGMEWLCMKIDLRSMYYQLRVKEHEGTGYAKDYISSLIWTLQILSDAIWINK